MSHSFPKDDDVPPSAPPPTYEEALNAPPVLPGRPAATSPPQQDCYTAPNAPPPQPPRPSVQGPSYGNPSQNNQGAHPVNSSSSSLYTNNPDLPFDYPRGHFCNKCKNTGFKESGKPCSKCWPKFFRDRSYNPNPSLPFTYPKGYICDKCRNTGVKLKNGQSCQDCYTFFAPRNHTSQTPLTFSAPYPVPFAPFGYSSPAFGAAPGFGPGGFAPPGPPGPPGPPQFLQPGDPRMGGTLCGRCRGTGMVHFFLDKELCQICGGVGRLFNSQHPAYR